jgi:DNA processing protein
MPESSQRSRYVAPPTSAASTLSTVMLGSGRPSLAAAQLGFLQSDEGVSKGDVPVYYAGDLTVLEHRCVSIVGTREVTTKGWDRAARLARELVNAGVVVVSGLAKGVDTAALTSAIEHGGRVAAVIGTPLEKAYPAENAKLQSAIWREHLLLTPFAEGERVFRSNFPKRNRVMAAISDATVIVEASDTSGTLHQAAECQRLGRWLFIMRSVAEDPKLSWPKSFLGRSRTQVLERTDDILDALSK